MNEFNLKFDNWANYLFDENRYRNISISKNALVEHFLQQHPSFKAFFDGKFLKSELHNWASRNNLSINPHKKGGRDMSNSIEYITVADQHFEKRRLSRAKSL